MIINRDDSRGYPAIRALVLGLFLVATSGAAWSATTLNLKDADINAVIETVSRATGKNFIVDPRVKGRVIPEALVMSLLPHCQDTSPLALVPGVMIRVFVSRLALLA